MERTTVALIFWLFIHVGGLAILALCAFLIPSSITAATVPLAQPVPENVSFFDMGTEFFLAPTLSGQVLYSHNASMVRFQQVYSDFITGSSFFLCNSKNVTQLTFLSVCFFIPVLPVGLSPPYRGHQGELYWQGNYNFFVNVSFLPQLAAIVRVNQRLLLGASAFVSPPPFNASNIKSGSALADPRTFGVLFDLSQMFLFFALFLLCVTVVTCLLYWSSRLKLQITIILMCCIFFNVLFVILQASNAIQSSSQCFVLGLFQHLTACSMVAFYALSTFHFFCVIYQAGRFQALRFDQNRMVYLVLGFGFALLDVVIVGALESIQLGFGPMAPWRFCWVRTASSFYVLGISFFLPAGLAMIFNLTLTTILSVYILKVRHAVKGSKGIDRETVKAVIALFISCNIGTVGFCLLGLFTVLGDGVQGGNGSAIFILLSILLFVQSLVYWLVYFTRRSSLLIWGTLLTCQGEDFNSLQQPNSSLESLGSRGGSSMDQRGGTASTEGLKRTDQLNTATDL